MDRERIQHLVFLGEGSDFIFVFGSVDLFFLAGELRNGEVREVVFDEGNVVHQVVENLGFGLVRKNGASFFGDFESGGGEGVLETGFLIEDDFHGLPGLLQLLGLQLELLLALFFGATLFLIHRV